MSERSVSDQSPMESSKPVAEETRHQQKARIYRVATLGAGTFVHLVVCWLVLTIGHMSLAPVQFLGLFSLAASGFLLIAMLIAFEWNLSLEDPDMSLVQMLWALTIVLITTHFAQDLRPAVLLCGLAMVVVGANRLSQNEQIIFAVYGFAVYAMSLWFQAELSVFSWVTEIVIMIAFGLVLVVGPVLYRLEMGMFENALLYKNQELSVALERIRELAVKDELTGAYNRRYINEKLAEQKAMADRGGFRFSLCYVDLDFFKKVNDRFGHAAGDEVLSNFSGLCHHVVREVDCVARMGGEEFLLVLSGTNEQSAVTAAKRLVEGLKDMPVSGNEPNYRITASIGITEYRPGEAIKALVDRADKALYDAKRTGRNKVIIADAS